MSQSTLVSFPGPAASPPSLTITQDRHIFIVEAVVDAPAPAATLAQRSFLPPALHVIQENGASALAKGEGPRYWQCQATAQLTTHHVGIHNVPVIIANTAPGTAVHDLQAPSAAAWAPYQPQFCKKGHKPVRWGIGRPKYRSVAGPCQLGSTREQMKG